MDIWLYLHFPSLQLDTLFTEDEYPIVIIDGKKNQVKQLNHVSQTEGIVFNMGLGSAAAMCSSLQVHPYNEETERQYLKRIAQWLYLVTSDISIVEPNGLMLKVSNMLTLYQSLESYWLTLKAHLSQLPVRYSFATGYSPYSAKLLATIHLNKVTDNKAWLEQVLSKQSLSFTELKPKTIEKLNRVGIQNLEGLLKISLTDIAKRFDIELVNYIGRLTGQLKHLVDYYHPPEKFEHYLELLFEIENVQWLEKPLYKLYLLLENFLYIRDKRAQELLVTLHLRDAEKVQVSVVSAIGEYKAKRWLELSQLRLESLELTAPVTGITLQVKQLMANEGENKDLFSKYKGEGSALSLVSLLQAKLGQEQVRGIKLIDDHRPENASQLCEPLATYEINNKNGKSFTKSKMLRPSFLLRLPQPLIEHVSIQHGPERIVSGWWDKSDVCRDYFVARTSKGQWLWVFRTPKQQWFVHGFFS